MRSITKSLVFPAIMVAFLAALLAAGPVMDGYAQQFTEQFRLPGVVPPTGCRVGAVLSTDAFTTTGFSNVRLTGPSADAVAGAWVVADNFVTDTGVVAAPNCPGTGLVDDGKALNIIGIRLKPTITSAQDADVQKVRLYEDVNLNAQFDPLLDIQIGQQPGSTLDTQDGAVFFYGPQQPIRTLGDVGGTTAGTGTGTGTRCTIQSAGGTVSVPTGYIFHHTQTRQDKQTPCAVGFLAIAEVGGQPVTGSQFGLEMEVLAADIPSPSFAQNAADFSSGVSSTQNPTASNVRLMFVGGAASSFTPLEHVSNGSGSPESAIETLTFTGGEVGEGLLSRFRARRVEPGTREAVAIAVGLCDGSDLANTNASILPQIAGAPPTIAGGLATLPCIASAGTDGLATGINGATLIFTGPSAQHMGTVRMYADIDSDGILFEPGEIVQQVTPVFNEQTDEAIAVFGGRQGQILFAPGATGAGGPFPVAGGVTAAAGGGVGRDAAGAPLVIVYTVDIDANATPGTIEVKHALQSFDDTAQGSLGPCGSATPVGAGTVAGFCGSNFSSRGPNTDSFEIQGEPRVERGVAQFDTNGDGVIGDNEFFAAVDGWIAGDVDDTLFFDVVDAWVGQTQVASAGTKALSLNAVSLSSAARGTTFAVSGQGISSMGVEIFDLSGQKVFSREVAGKQLTWAQSTSAGQPVANGVYLYRVTVQDGNGNVVSSDIKKLVIVK